MDLSRWEIAFDLNGLMYVINLLEISWGYVCYKLTGDFFGDSGSAVALVSISASSSFIPSSVVSYNLNLYHRVRTGKYE